MSHSLKASPGRRRPLAFLLWVIPIALVLRSASYGQGESAVPFLLITSSPAMNGMGGISSIHADDPYAPLGNPANIGVFSLSTGVNAALFAPRSDWLPQFQINNLNYEVKALNGGIRLNDLIDLPVPVGLGAGYSDVHLNLGTFNVTASGSPLVIARFSSWEESKAVSVGLGVDLGVRIGIGWNFKSIHSELSPIGTEQEKGNGVAEVKATDFGVLVQAPLLDLIAGDAASDFPFAGVRPFAGVTLGYSRSNVGGEVLYLDAMPDPLPRQAAAGLMVELGVASTVFPEWKYLSFIWARQGEDVLVDRASNGRFTYKSGLGSVSLVDDLLLGRRAADEGIRRGWELSLGDLIAVRKGSVEQPGLVHGTDGFGVRLAGALRLLRATVPALHESAWFRFVAEHVDLRYDRSNYGGTESPIDGTTFRSLSIVVR